MNRTVTAVIPNYNYARYLPARVESILSQKYPVSELIILDDNSSDKSREVIDQIIKKLAHSHPNLKTKSVINSKNSGKVFRQWAKAFEEASSDYLWICEADDLCDESFLGSAMRGFEKDKSVVISYTDSKMVDDSGRTIMKSIKSWSGYDGYEHWYNDYINDGKKEIADYMAINNTIINVSSVVFKIREPGSKKLNLAYLEYLEKASTFRLAGDWYFYAKVLENGKIAYCNEPHNLYRSHEGSVSKTTDDLTHYQEIVSIQNDILKDVELPEKTLKLINSRRSKLIKDWDLLNKFTISDTPLISVIVPAYNIETFLPACVESIESQSYKNFEVILVDDGSTDHTPEICDKYKGQFKNISIVHQKNAGLSSARNTGINKAKGEYLAFVDGDDLVAPEFLTQLYKVANLSCADISECGYVEFDKAAAPTSRDHNLKIYTTSEAVTNLLIGQENKDVVTWNKLYKKELFRDIKFPVGELHEDNLTTYKLLGKSPNVAVFDDELYCYRQRSGSIMAEQDLLARLNQKERSAREAIEYFDKNSDLKQSAKVALLLSKFAYLDNIASGRIHDKNLWQKTVKEIKQSKKEYQKNPHLTKKLKLYLALLKAPFLYRLFRKIIH